MITKGYGNNQKIITQGYGGEEISSILIRGITTIPLFYKSNISFNKNKSNISYSKVN